MPPKPKLPTDSTAVTIDFDHLSQAQIAALHGITARSIRDWDRAGHPRNSTDGTYRGRASIEWRIAREATGGLSLAGERAALAREQKIEKSMQNARARGDLVSLAVVEKLLGQAVMNIRTNALALPSKVAAALENRSAAEIRAVLDREIRRLLEGIASIDFADKA